MTRNGVQRILTLGLALMALGMPREAFAKKKDYPERPILTIRTVDIAPGLEDVVGLTTAAGAYVVEAQAPAQKSDDIPIDVIRVWDLIVGIDDQIVNSSEHLRQVISAKKVGDRVKVRVIREGHLQVLGITVKSSPPLIYLPADTCPSPTVGTLSWLDFPVILFSGYPVFGIAPTDLSGRCHFLVEACTPLQLVKQTQEHTVIEIKGFNHQIRGNWQAHTHLGPGECLEEKARLEALRLGGPR